LEVYCGVIKRTIIRQVTIIIEGYRIGYSITCICVDSFAELKKHLVAFYVNQTRIPASLLFTLQNLKVPPRSSKLTGFLFMRLFIHEEIYIIQDLAENMITRAKFKRSINLEVNKTEFWSVNSE
jgi:hypothetical protein